LILLDFRDGFIKKVVFLNAPITLFESLSFLLLLSGFASLKQQPDMRALVSERTYHSLGNGKHQLSSAFLTLSCLLPCSCLGWLWFGKNQDVYCGIVVKRIVGGL
jgi:hypothetical protein